MSDPTEYWPREWRHDFELQNKLLDGAGDEPLHPREYLQCRYEDTCEVREQDEAVRSQRHHEVFLKMLEQSFGHGLWTMENGDSPSGQDVDGWRMQCVEAARQIADLAYPKPEVKP